MTSGEIRFRGTIKNGKHAGTVVESDLTDVQAASLLRDSDSDFARDLVSAYDKYGGRLTAGRRVWLHKLALEARDRSAKPRVDRPGIPAARLDEMFDFARASGNLKRPRIDVDVEGIHFVLQVASERSKNPGAIYVKSASRRGGVPTYLGKIIDGTFHPAFEYDHLPEVKAAFDALNADPVNVIAQGGLKSGRCCYCRLQLTDERSLAAGYGPVCAKNWNLPWGGETETDRESRREERRQRAEANRNPAHRSSQVTREQRAAATAAVDCPKCGARAGEPCKRRTGGKAPTFHLARYDAWRALDDGAEEQAEEQPETVTLDPYYNTEDVEGREYDLVEDED